jgi:hypothetical protein
LCYRKETCMHGDNEPLCNQTQNNSGSYSICSNVNSLSHTMVQTFLCARQIDTRKSAIVHFFIDNYKQLTNQDQMTRFIQPPSTRQYDQRCHRVFMVICVSIKINELVSLCNFKPFLIPHEHYLLLSYHLLMIVMNELFTHINKLLIFTFNIVERNLIFIYFIQLDQNFLQKIILFILISMKSFHLHIVEVC